MKISLLNKKVSRKNFSEESSNNNNDIIIKIDKSEFYQYEPKNFCHNYYKTINNKKSSIIEAIEKSSIIYGKCPYNNISTNYKIEKINLDIPIIPKICSKPILFISLIYYNNKSLLFIGHSFNLLVYEIKGNNYFFLSSVFTIEQNDSFLIEKIDKIYLLNENNLSEIINFVIIGRTIHLYEFNLRETAFMSKRIIFFDSYDSNMVKYKLIKFSSKLFIYDEKNIKICDLIDRKYIKLELTLGDSDDNIKIIQNFSNNLYIFLTDKFFYIFDTKTESIIHKIQKKLQFGWEKILLLNNNQFLLYCDSSAIIYNYDFDKKFALPQINKKLDISNIKNINKILRIKSGDLVIFYDCFNFAVFDLKYNFIKYKKIGKELNYICNDLFPREIQPNIIAYKTDLYNINFVDIKKGDILGSFGIKKNNILSFKNIKKYYITKDKEDNNNKIYYFILAGKSSYIFSN